MANLLFRGGWLLGITLCLVACGSGAQATPTSQNILTPVQHGVTGFDFRGVVSFDNVGFDSWSGSLVRTPFSQPNEGALILANGHSDLNGDYVPPNTIVLHQPSSLKPRLYIDASPQGRTVQLHVRETVYRTMTKTDVALYRLVETYADIESRYQVEPFLISSAHPTVNQAVTIPSGYFREAYACTITNFVNELHEGDWIFSDSFRFVGADCNPLPGSSGSPLIDPTTGELVGVSNTVNNGGDDCTANNPCEVDGQGVHTAHAGAHYGQETYWIPGCFRTDGTFDLTLASCELFSHL